MSKSRRVLRGAMLVMSAGSVAACSSNLERPAASAYAEDAVTTSRVQAALKAQSLDVTDIRVDTFRGVVRLSGFAWDRQSADLAEAAARRVAGVTDVKNEIVLRGGGRQSF